MTSQSSSSSSFIQPIENVTKNATNPTNVMTPQAIYKQATDLLKNNNILKTLFNNIKGLNSNTNKELSNITNSINPVKTTQELFENVKSKFISKLENENIQNIIKQSSSEFGKKLGNIGNSFMINDNPVADVFFSIKNVFDLVLYEFFNILLFINIVFFNVDETVAINNFNSNISNSNIIDNFLLTILFSVKNISESLLKSIKNEAFSIIFKFYKTDKKTVDLISNLSNDIIHNTVDNFFHIIYISNFNSPSSIKLNKQTPPAIAPEPLINNVQETLIDTAQDTIPAEQDTAEQAQNPTEENTQPEIATLATSSSVKREPDIQKMVGGKLKKLKTKKQKILKRINTYLSNFYKTTHKSKSKTLKRRR
jgi:hypothetical protein